MEAVVVTIGRNVQDIPLGDVQWQTFCEEVEEVVLACTETLVVRSEGFGEWEGTVEENFTAVGIVEERYHSDRWLRHELAHLATKYRQDAVALITGESTLVESAVKS